MSLSDLLNSRWGILLGLQLSQSIKPRLGYPFACWVADRLSGRQRAAMVRAVRSNQWIVHDRRISAQQLNLLVRETFRNSARSLYEFWHHFKDSKAVLDLVDFDQSVMDLIRRIQMAERGMVVVAPHMSNFDLLARATALRGVELHVLSYPQPTGGYRWQNKLRQAKLPGMTVTPMSIQALRKASETLNANKTVITGVDRPLPTGEAAKYRPHFFGRPAALPVFHIRLALKHNVPITVLGGARKPDGCYHIWASDPIPMRRHNDLMQEMIENAEEILSVIAGFIRKAPDQWAMFYPVWPETINEPPNP